MCVYIYIYIYIFVNKTIYIYIYTYIYMWPTPTMSSTLTPYFLSSSSTLSCSLRVLLVCSKCVVCISVLVVVASLCGCLRSN